MAVLTLHVCNVQVKNVVTTSLEKILMERDVEGAKDYVKSTISDLLMNRLDLSLLVVTKVGSMTPSADFRHGAPER